MKKFEFRLRFGRRLVAQLATSHYLNQCLQRSVASYGVTRQLVDKHYGFNRILFEFTYNHITKTVGWFFYLHFQFISFRGTPNLKLDVKNMKWSHYVRAFVWDFILVEHSQYVRYLQLALVFICHIILLTMYVCIYTLVPFQLGKLLITMTS